ncbi:uncharacterized protein LOC119078911 [Bradysia coprophila]|uniref:uncharacterized protein LOC119078911 n=1 Tax=Bradysia coprophila TaxID=38358 RepID=UPI00187DD395|nr:uncharacterized protein LOC119078911 [Bradysia coprophila]XP_037042537.1 uncharacterized protein LOC119078911 [Bradysia coprophila]
MTDKCHKHSHHSHHKSGDRLEMAHSHNTWKADDYEQKLKVMNYNGHKLAVNHFVEFGVPKDAKILDLAAGTGLVGFELSENGYTNIDALDGSDEMLVVAKERNCYQNVMTHLIQKSTKLPIADHTYDHIVMSGALCHIDFENLPAIIKTCKPGGIICWAIGQSEDLVRIEPKFKDGHFEQYIESLCAEKLWEFVAGFPKRVNNYAMERDGWVYAMKVL